MLWEHIIGVGLQRLCHSLTYLCNYPAGKKKEATNYTHLMAVNDDHAFHGKNITTNVFFNIMLNKVNNSSFSKKKMIYFYIAIHFCDFVFVALSSRK